MKNVSTEFWSRMPAHEATVPASEWVALAGRFDGWTKQDFYKSCLPSELENSIKVMASKMFHT